MAIAYYPAVIERGAKGFGVFFPDVPGCTSGGGTLQEAARNAEEALQGHLDIAAEHGDSLPVPSALDGVTADPAVVEVARLLVRVALPAGSDRVTITHSG